MSHPKMINAFEKNTSSSSQLVGLCNYSIYDKLDGNNFSNSSCFGEEEDYSDSENGTSGAILHLSIALYSVVFLLSVVGNILVFITLSQKKRMRTVTNTFLFSLAVSDLLFALFCMPDALTYAILQRYVFGNFCKIMPYFQNVSVFVSVWTLVSISLERYFAICRPLTSMVWQTKSHALKLIVGVWIAGFILFIPSIFFSQLLTIKNENGELTAVCTDRYWPNLIYGKVIFTSFFVIIMVIPFIIMTVAYTRVIMVLRQRMKYYNTPEGESMPYERTPSLSKEPKISCTMMAVLSDKSKQPNGNSGVSSESRKSSNTNRKRVVNMLLVVVILFFVCWSPLWAINLWSVYDVSIHARLDAMDVLIVKLLAYINCCCNPIIYCFMNKRFREGLLDAFGIKRKNGQKANIANGRPSTPNMANTHKAKICLRGCITPHGGEQSPAGSPHLTVKSYVDLDSYQPTPV